MRAKLSGFLLAALLAAALILAVGCVPKRHTPPGAPQRTFYSINPDSRVFHKPGCPHYNCRNCRPGFNSRARAVKAGYRPCRVCKP